MVRHEPDERALSDVSAVLWRERQLLELLVFKLEEEQLLLSAGKARWVGHATRELEAVLGRLRAAELLRAVRVEVAGAELGLGSSPALRALAQAAPEPWRYVFSRHRHAFLGLASEARQLSERNSQLLARGRGALRAAGEGALPPLARASRACSGGGGGGAVPSSGPMPGEPTGTQDFDQAEVAAELGLAEACYEAALAATARVIAPSLEEFLF